MKESSSKSQKSGASEEPAVSEVIFEDEDPCFIRFIDGPHDGENRRSPFDSWPPPDDILVAEEAGLFLAADYKAVEQGSLETEGAHHYRRDPEHTSKLPGGIAGVARGAEYRYVDG